MRSRLAAAAAILTARAVPGCGELADAGTVDTLRVPAAPILTGGHHD